MFSDGVGVIEVLDIMQVKNISQKLKIKLAKRLFIFIGFSASLWTIEVTALEFTIQLLPVFRCWVGQRKRHL